MALRSKLVVDPILLRIDEAQGLLDWREIFGNDHPVELEIGSGKGTFLLTAATKHPERNFVGIEWAKAYCEYAADRMRRHGRFNCRLVRAEADAWIRTHVAEATVAAVHIYFPDPWPKKRHHKRRLVQPLFWRQLDRILQPDGMVRIVTDHQEYFRAMEEVIAGGPLTRRPFETPLQESTAELVGTNFERKYALEAREFYRLAAVKCG